MILPTIAAGVCAFCALFAIYRRRLPSPMDAHPAEFEITDRVGLLLGVLHLGVCTVALAISSYIGLEMYKISLACVCSLFVTVLISCALRKKRPMGLVRSFFRAPWQLVPFVLSMFVMIVVLSQKGATVYISQLLSEKFTVFSYGLSSFLASNVINNIPMSVLFSSVIEHLPQSLQMKAMYATVVGSNLGAFLSPIGALAGIMWSSILALHGTGFSLRDFLRMGVRVAVPSVVCALAVLSLVL
jgi:arsenical pump membrane protein